MSPRTTFLMIALMALVVSVSCNQSQNIKCRWYAMFSGKTANGDKWDSWALTGAHPTLPFGTKVKVTFGTHEQLITINDRPSNNEDALLVTSGVQAKLDLPRGEIKQCSIEY